MNRRELLAAAAALVTAGPGQAATDPLRTLARDAYFYTLPLVEIANAREAFFRAGARPGRFYGRRQLATSETRTVTAPNVDTLNGMAFVDLSRGTARIRVPSLTGRYACVALLDMFSNDIAVIDPRSVDGFGHDIVLSGPGSLPQPTGIRSTTPWVWMIVRVLVDGPEDVGNAAHVLDGFEIESAPAGGAAPGVKTGAEWQEYFAAANRLLLENPPLEPDRAFMARIAPLGLGSQSFDVTRLVGDDASAMAAGTEDARRLLRSGLPAGKIVDGWAFESADTGKFGVNYLARAQVALGGLAALPISEALYLAALAPTGGRFFSGNGPWRLHFAAGATPPVDAFWSLTMYSATSEGHFILAANPINRYSIGDRTRGLIFDSDGSLTIWIARSDPGGARVANWLPAPASGPFSIVLRAYEPKLQMTSGAYVPPPIVLA